MMEDKFMVISWPVKMIDNYQLNFLLHTEILPTEKTDGCKL